MIKKILSILLIISVLSVESFAFSYSKSGIQSAYNMGKLGVLKAEVFEDSKEVTRYEALKTIMLVISGNNNCDYGDIGVTDGLYQDFEYDLDNWLRNDKFLYEYSNGSTDYIALAFYNDIAEGINVDGKDFFMFEKKSTVAETLTFMIRCLTGRLVTMEEAHIYAKDCGLILKDEIYYDAYTNCLQNIEFDYFCIVLERFVNQKRYMYLNIDDENFPNVSIDIDGTMTYKEYIMQNIAKNGMYSIESTGIIFTSEMAKEVADMVFKAKLGDYFVVQNSELTIDEFDGMYKITRKPPLPATSSGATIYINMYNGAVMDFITNK